MPYELPPIDPSRINDALAGFFGGLVYAIRFPLGSGLKTLAAIFIGTMAAHYLTKDVAHYIPISEEAAGFLIGFGFYNTSQAIIDRISKMIKR